MPVYSAQVDTSSMRVVAVTQTVELPPDRPDRIFVEIPELLPIEGKYYYGGTFHNEAQESVR